MTGPYPPRFGFAGRIAAWLPWALPAFALLYLGLIIAGDGLAMDAAIPVPSYMVAGIKMPAAAYRDSAEALSRANPADGNAQVARAEANMMAGAPGPVVERQLTDALARAPANVRGWTLLSEVQANTKPPQSAGALSVAFMLAPYDFFLGGRRVRDAAMAWGTLDPQTQRAAQRGAALLSTEPQLKPQYDALLATPVGQRIQSMVIQNVLVPDLSISVGR